MGNLRRAVRLVAVPLVIVLVVAACSGSHQAAARPTQQGPATSSQGRLAARTMRFVLGDKQLGPVTAQVPATPLGTTPTTVPGVTLELYLAERVSRNAVLVVFALNVPSGGISVGLETQMNQALSGLGNDINGDRNAWDAVSGVSLFDPVGLKQYQTYMADPTDDDTCLCTTALTGYNFQPGSNYFAALVAAPPANVKSVSFVTGLGTIGDVTLSR